MQMHEATEVVEVLGALNANAKIADGWKLLAVTSAGNGSADGRIFLWYVLGRIAKKKMNISATALAGVNEGLKRDQ